MRTAISTHGREIPSATVFKVRRRLLSSAMPVTIKLAGDAVFFERIASFHFGEGIDHAQGMDCGWHLSFAFHGRSNGWRGARLGRYAPVGEFQDLWFDCGTLRRPFWSHLSSSDRHRKALPAGGTHRFLQLRNPDSGVVAIRRRGRLQGRGSRGLRRLHAGTFDSYRLLAGQRHSRGQLHPAKSRAESASKWLSRSIRILPDH